MFILTYGKNIYVGPYFQKVAHLASLFEYFSLELRLEMLFW